MQRKYLITQPKAYKALVVVHIFGNMANLERILRLQAFNIKVIEDATEAIGTIIYCLYIDIMQERLDSWVSIRSTGIRSPPEVA